MNSLPRIDHLIDLAIEEDAGLGDVTSRAIFSAKHRRAASSMRSRTSSLCGLEVATRVFQRVDPALKVTPLAHDGDRVKQGARVLSVTGPTASMLTAERTALNFVQRLSGIATLARTLRRRGRGHGRPDRRYAQDDAGLARAGEIRGALRRLFQSPLVARRARVDQGQPHRGRRLADAGGEAGASRGAASREDRGGGEDAGGSEGGAARRRPR